IAARRGIRLRIVRIDRIARERIRPPGRRSARERAPELRTKELEPGLQRVLAVPGRNEIADRVVDLDVELLPPLRRVGRRADDDRWERVERQCRIRNQLIVDSREARPQLVDEPGADDPRLAYREVGILR